MAVGCDRHSYWPPAGAVAGDVPGGEEGEAAAGGQGQQQQGETPLHCHRQRPQIQDLRAARGPPRAAGPIQPRERQDQLEEEEESKRSGEEEEKGTTGGGFHSDAVSRCCFEKM